jgi:cobalt-precorrin-5B (C1)-methyltransferase
VVGGISILGTSGFVEPYSNEAYIETVRILVSGARSAGLEEIVFATGGSTVKAAMRLHPELPETAFVRMGDFIEESLGFAAKSGFARATIACMEGKLLKYASGVRNTHAWKSAQEMSSLRPFLEASGIDATRAGELASCASVREAVSSLSFDERARLAGQMAAKALKNFKTWASSVEIGIDVFDSRGECLARHKAGG